MESKHKKYLLILSIITVILISFIPNIGFRIESGSRVLGFPADWLSLHSHGGFGFKWLGLLVNIAFFYFVYWLFITIFMRLKTRKSMD